MNGSGWRLRCTSGPAQGQIVSIAPGSKVVVGRTPECDFPVPSPEMSRRHFEVAASADGLVVHDLGSSNGTRVNGERIPGPVRLRAGDSIEIGPIAFSIEEKAAAPAALGETRLASSPVAGTGPVRCALCGTTFEGAGSLCPECYRLDEPAGATVSLPPTVPATHQLGPYEIHEALGKGACSVVFKAWDPRHARWVVLKVLVKSQGMVSEARERFLREARIVSKLDHPRIVSAVEVGSAEGIPFIAMPLVPGRDAERLVQESGPQDWRRALGWAVEVAEGLHFAHERGLVHRDVKPANLLIDAEGHARILDFGLARILDDLEGNTGLTGSKATLGTPLYIPPEQIRGAHDADRRADVYALGATLVFLLSGKPPFAPGGDLTELLVQVARSAPPRMCDRGIACPDRIDEILARAMAKDPARRYPTADDLRRDLVQVLASK